MTQCDACLRNQDIPSLPEWDRAYVTEYWRLAHAWSALEGWLVLIPRRHVQALDELTDPEAAEIGPLLAAATAALRELVACEKTYVMLFAEQEGHEHLHFHVVPRMRGFEKEHTGPGVFEFLRRPESEWVPVPERNRLAMQVGDLMAGRFSDPS